MMLHSCGAPYAKDMGVLSGDENKSRSIMHECK
jgi:hypothetical protein